MLKLNASILIILYTSSGKLMSNDINRLIKYLKDRFVLFIKAYSDLLFELIEMML